MGARKKPELAEGEAYVSDAAAFVGIATEQMQKLIRDGYVEKAPGKWAVVNLQGAVRGYVGYLKDDQRRSSQSAAASRVKDARAQEIELRIAEKSKTLMPTVDALAAMTNVFGILKSELIGLPARATRDLVLRRRLENEIDESLTRCCDRIDAMSDGMTAADLPDLKESLPPTPTGNRRSRRAQKRRAGRS